ncbi:amino acid carrier protein [Cryomorpha ignava]|uniref:Amino acid carrier protein n=1 Tax=Cryomorpha ignava TaxID=101383 RepID=A0A7K3WMH6_9FLAO|nr:alanine/glycine:cation symporter family protein [Cryomorpha ignava]NEN22853.1 amino acid carrier protein [Cryomorpha ignava]
MKKAIYLLVALFLTINLNAQLNAKLEVANDSETINDGRAQVIILSGTPPYKYQWSNEDTELDSDMSTGLTEGVTFNVAVSDATGDTIRLEGKIPATSTEEAINSVFLPVVNGLFSVLFWDPFATFGLYDPVVYADEKRVFATGYKQENVEKIFLMKWFQPEGAEVKEGDKLALLRRNTNDTITIYAAEPGKIHHWFSEGEIVFDRSDVASIAKANTAVFGTVVYDTPRPVLKPNGTIQKNAIPLIVVWLILGALFFTIRMGFINFTGVKQAINLVRGKYSDPSDKGEVSHFQALTTALSATVGLGNIAGVAVAIVVGGAGATFWMIVAGLLGMASKFVECTLGVKYRKINEKGEVSGGPMYYLSEGLKRRNMAGLGKVLAVLFAILCIGASFGGGNMFQANQAFVQVSAKVPLFQDNGALFGVILAIFVGLVIVGGIKSIARVTDKIVPFMVAVYVGFALIIIFMNIENLHAALSAIWHGAFSPSALRGGVIGVLVIGFQRAAFSNEAGVGSASIAHSASRTKYPISEGIVALLEPFIDTVVVCTMTALVLIFTGFANDAGGMNGSELTSAAFSSVFSWFDWVLLVAIVLFAFSTMISWSYYGLKAWSYLFGSTKASEYSYKLLFLIFVVIGSSVGLGSVLDFSDLMILGMAFPNILGLFLLSGEVRADLKSYFKGIKEGTIKRFK